MTATRARLVLTDRASTLIGVTAGLPARAKEPVPNADNGVVIRLQDTASIGAVTLAFPVQVDRPLLASRSIYLLRVTDPTIAGDPKKTAELAKKIDHFSAVGYAEPNDSTTISDSRFHSWPEGTPVDAGTDPAPWATQPITDYLNLTAAHQITAGAGSVVAVLDTGSDPTIPP